MRMLLSASGHSSELSMANHSSRSTVSQLKGVSDTISEWCKNLQPQRTQISIVANASFIQNSTWLASSVECNCKFSQLTFSTPATPKATSKLFSSQGCSDDKNWLYFSSIFFKIYRFCSSFSFAVSFHSTRSGARVKFDSGVISWTNQNSFATHLYGQLITSNGFFRVCQSVWRGEQRPAFESCWKILK